MTSSVVFILLCYHNQLFLEHVTMHFLQQHEEKHIPPVVTSHMLATILQNYSHFLQSGTFFRYITFSIHYIQKIKFNLTSPMF